MTGELLVQFSAGQGPAECSLAVTLAWQRFTIECERAGLALALLEREPGPVVGTWKSLLCAVSGNKLELLKSWQGTMQWICKSPYRPDHGRKNWFFSVHLHEAEQEDSAADGRQQYEVRTVRAQGPGGQHVNTTCSAVQMVHKPTRLRVQVQAERSQHRNRQLAWMLIQHKLKQRAQTSNAAARGRLRMIHHRLERGNAVRIFYGPEFRDA